MQQVQKNVDHKGIMIMHMRKSIIMSVIVLNIAAESHATLMVLGNDSIGNQLIYDSDLNVTWYDYSRLSDTWQEQLDWASNLVVNFEGQNITGWRLPQTLPVNGSTYNYYNYTVDGSSDVSINISAPSSAYPESKGSELAYLFYNDLGNNSYLDTSGNPIDLVGLYNAGPFKNLVNYIYWSGTVYDPNPDNAWVFYMYDGFQGSLNIANSDIYAIAVVPGLIEVNPVPEPSTLLLVGVGLTGLGLMRYKRRRSC